MPPQTPGASSGGLTCSAGATAFWAHRIANQKGPNSQQLNVFADQSRATVKTIWWHCKDGPVQHVFPITGKIPGGLQPGLQYRLMVATAGHQHRTLKADPAGIAEMHGRDGGFFAHAQQAKAGFMNIGDNIDRNFITVLRRNNCAVGFQNQISDGTDQTLIVDDYPAALTVGAKKSRRTGVLWNGCPNMNDGFEQIFFDTKNGRSGKNECSENSYQKNRPRFEICLAVFNRPPTLLQDFKKIGIKP